MVNSVSEIKHFICNFVVVVNTAFYFQMDLRQHWIKINWYSCHHKYTTEHAMWKDWVSV